MSRQAPLVHRSLSMTEEVAETLRITAEAAGLSEGEVLKRGIVAMKLVVEGHVRGLVPGAAKDPSLLDERFDVLVPA